MVSSATNSALLVFEFNGTARSGKGTIVSYLADKYPDLAVEETGIDYRAITRALISGNIIGPHMPETEILDEVAALELGALTDIVANRSATISAHGSVSLYLPDVNGLVATIGKVEIVRKAVKAGFIKRVEGVRDSGKYKILLVDGRNLAQVLRDIEATRLLLRVFVTCTVAEATRRECVRSGVSTNSPEGRAVFASLDKRTQADALRELDPVKPDVNVLDYWHPPLGVDRNQLGAVAARDNRQIYLDTTNFGTSHESKNAMCQAAEQIFNSALQS